MPGLETRVARAEALPGPGRMPAVTDRSPWDWYAESCPCGLPPGRVPRASPGPGEPAARPRATGGSGRTWPDAGPARRGPAPAGSSTASRRAP